MLIAIVNSGWILNNNLTWNNIKNYEQIFGALHDKSLRKTDNLWDAIYILNPSFWDIIGSIFSITYTIDPIWKKKRQNSLYV